MDAIELLIGSKVKWTPDRIKTLAEIQPRHIGRVVTFSFFDNDVPEDYTAIEVIGTLEGRAGNFILASGSEYSWRRVADCKIWRSELV